jgi:small-conductance mechanosensitive channel
VIDEPYPIVLFEDFGDSSLVFTVHFWIHMRTIMDGSVIRSDIRVAIDDAFRRAGIVIAFPQRDVHIDLQSPIEVALTETQRSISRPMRRAA